MKFEKNVKVKLTDVNKTNKIKTSAIMNYFQELATLHSDSVGDGIYHLEKNQATWVIINFKMKIYGELKWNDECIVTTWSRKLQKVYAYRDYKMCDKEGNIIAIASSKWLYIDLQTKAIKVPPKELIDKYKSEDIPVFEDDGFQKFKEPEDKKLVYTYNIQKRDIDWNQHVNNVAYVDMIQEALEEDVEIKDIEIIFKKECKYGASINIYSNETSNGDKLFTLKDRDTDMLYVLAHIG